MTNFNDEELIKQYSSELNNVPEVTPEPEPAAPEIDYNQLATNAWFSGVERPEVTEAVFELWKQAWIEGRQSIQ